MYVNTRVGRAPPVCYSQVLGKQNSDDGHQIYHFVFLLLPDSSVDLVVATSRCCGREPGVVVSLDCLVFQF